MKVAVLGTEYEIIDQASVTDYPYLEDCDGYCDFYDHKIILGQFTKENGYEHGDLAYFGRKVLRHELVHAFLHESGMHDQAMDEQLVDWIAIQFPKLNKLFDQLEIKA
jgi:hypothetical protein